MTAKTMKNEKHLWGRFGNNVMMSLFSVLLIAPEGRFCKAEKVKKTVIAGFRSLTQKKKKKILDGIL
jgi:hypothetical protein